MADAIVLHEDCYVYILYREDGVTPFYVGMGRRGRWLHHERDAKRGRSRKDNIICRMRERGISVPKKKYAEGLTRQQAALLEIELIAKIGRHPKGPLANLTDGGEGVRGWVVSAKRRAELRESWKPHAPEVEKRRIAACIAAANDPARCKKISAALKGKKKAADHIANLSMALRGKKYPNRSKEWRISISRALTGKERSAAHRAALSARKISAASIEKMRASLIGRRLSDSHRAAISAGAKGKPKPDGFGEKIRVALTGRSLSQETIEKIRVSNTGKTLSDETKAKMSASRQGKKKSPEHAAKLAANLQRYWAERRAAKEVMTT